MLTQSFVKYNLNSKIENSEELCKHVLFVVSLHVMTFLDHKKLMNRRVGGGFN